MTSMLAKLLLRPNIVTRDEWSALIPRKTDPINQEVTNLVISFTEGPPCNNKEECVRIVKEIQKKHVNEQNKDDIQYNFLIGSDGNVYEGRGWKNAPTYQKSKKELQKLNGNAIEIAFIGKSSSKPSMKMLKALAGLVVKGMGDKVISKNITKLHPCMIVGDKLLEITGDKNETDLQNLDENQLIDQLKSTQITQ